MRNKSGCKRIQIQCTGTDVDAHPLHERKVSALEWTSINISAIEIITSAPRLKMHVLA